jgi:DNA modification methylase
MAKKPPIIKRTSHGSETRLRSPLQQTSIHGLTCYSGKTQAGIDWQMHRGDAADVLSRLSENRFACAITSPPYYWQRDYGVIGQIGLEPDIESYVSAIAGTMDQVRRTLREDGVLFLNLGDTYYSAKGQPKGSDPKNRARRFGLRAVDASGLGVPRKTVIGIPWRVAIEMISRGWILRAPIIWRRDKSMPEPTAKDRPWRTYEMVFMFAKRPRYRFNRSALGSDEDIWTISDKRKHNNGLHAATFPDALVEKCLAVGCSPGGEVLDPFAGCGTVLRVSLTSGHPAVGIDLSQEFCRYAAEQLDMM